MTNAFEYGDALLPEDTDKNAAEFAHNKPYLNLATYVPFSLIP